jgi:hypothetical protein
LAVNLTGRLNALRVAPSLNYAENNSSGTIETYAIFALEPVPSLTLLPNLHENYSRSTAKPEPEKSTKWLLEKFVNVECALHWLNFESRVSANNGLLEIDDTSGIPNCTAETYLTCS